jgi:hypothetical protein
MIFKIPECNGYIVELEQPNMFVDNRKPDGPCDQHVCEKTWNVTELCYLEKGTCNPQVGFIGDVYQSQEELKLSQIKKRRDMPSEYLAFLLCGQKAASENERRRNAYATG